MFEFFRRRKANGLLERAREAHRKGEHEAAARLLEEVIALDTDAAGNAAVLLGTMAHERGDLAETCRHLERARALMPEEGGLALQLGNDLRALGEHARAVAAYDAVLACAQRDPQMERRAVREAALTAFAMGAPDAGKRLERAVAGFALDLEVWSALAQHRIAAGDRPGARDALLRVLRSDRDHLEAHERLLSLTDESRARELAALWRPEASAPLSVDGALTALLGELRMGRSPEPAITALVQRAEESDAPVPRALAAFVLRNVPRRPSHIDEARALLVAADPKHPMVRYVGALLAIHEEREEDARALLERLHTEGLPLPSLAYLLGVRCEVAGEPERAEGLYREVLAADPDDAAVILQLAGVLRQQKRFTEAQEVMRRAYRTDPFLLSPRVEHLTGVVADRRVRARRRRIEARLNQAPDDREAQVDLVGVCNEGRAHREALRLANGLGDEASSARGYAHFALGELEDAEREYRAWLRRTPDDAEARMYLGQVLAMRSQEWEAQALLDASIDALPHRFEAPATMGIILSKRERPTEAEGHYRAAMRCDPTQMEPHLNLGIDFLKKVRLIDAEREFRFATVLAPENAEAHQWHARVLTDLSRDAEAGVAAGRARALRDGSMVRGLLGADLPVPGTRPLFPWAPEVRASLEELAAEVCGPG